MAALAHEMGHAFGLADTYIPVDKWGDPQLDKGGLDSTKGTQPASLMSGNSLDKEMEIIQHSVRMIRTVSSGFTRWFTKDSRSVDCFFSDYELENPPLGCVPKRPLIFELKHGIEVHALWMLEEDETLDLNARDADGYDGTAPCLHQRIHKVVDALLSFEDIDVNARDAKGLTALHHAVLLNAMSHEESKNC